MSKKRNNTNVNSNNVENNNNVDSNNKEDKKMKIFTKENAIKALKIVGGIAAAGALCLVGKNIITNKKKNYTSIPCFDDSDTLNLLNESTNDVSFNNTMSLETTDYTDNSDDIDVI